ncbi:MAG: hypothetical protein P0S96_04655 [Simkaniaceae bacterium]|nr:hypothetical protein [Candidatus Sacchlamyda saccharinae]
MCRSTRTAVTTPIPPDALQATPTVQDLATAVVGFLSTTALDMGIQDATTTDAGSIMGDPTTEVTQEDTTATLDAITDGIDNL